jgi:hypothetical protein
MTIRIEADPVASPRPTGWFVASATESLARRRRQKVSRLDRLQALRRPLLCLLLMFYQFACQKRPSIGLAPPDAFFPLAPGTTWKYRITDEVKNTTMTFTDKVERLPDGEELADDSGKGQASETVVSESFESDSQGQLLIVYKKNSKYIARSFSFGNLGNDSFAYRILSTEGGFLPRLLQPGITWSNTTFPFGNLSQDLRIVQKHAAYAEDGVVSVPAGQFARCVRVVTSAAFVSGSADARNERQHLRYIDWYAPNVGLVKTSLWKTGLFGKEIARVELVNFGVAPPANPPSPRRSLAHHAASHPGLMD